MVTVILTGKSGSGKTSILKALKERYANDPFIYFAKSVTTRKQRSDVDDEYYFTTKEEFSRMRKYKEVADCSKNFGEWYGSFTNDADILEKAKIAIVIRDPQTALKAKKKSPDEVFTIYVIGDSAIRFRAQRGRKEKRIDPFLFDDVVFNTYDALDKTTENVIKIIQNATGVKL